MPSIRHLEDIIDAMTVRVIHFWDRLVRFDAEKGLLSGMETSRGQLVMPAFIIALLCLVLAPGRLSAQALSVSTNLADCANLGTLNVEAAYGMSRHWSVSASVKYNPFQYGENSVQSRQRSVSVGARYWPWHVYSGWWTSGDLRYQEFRTVTAHSPVTTQGDRYGYVQKAGYSYMLGEHLNLELGAGLWAGYEVYSVYDCPHCGRKSADGAKSFFKISDIIVALSFIF